MWICVQIAKRDVVKKQKLSMYGTQNQDVSREPSTMDAFSREWPTKNPDQNMFLVMQNHASAMEHASIFRDPAQRFAAYKDHMRQVLQKHVDPFHIASGNTTRFT